MRLTLLLLFLIPFTAKGQLSVRSLRPAQVFGEIGGFFGPADQTPFWLQANQYGIVPSQMPQGSFRLGIGNSQASAQNTTPKSPSRTGRKQGWQVGYGLEAVVNTAADRMPKILLPEAYLNGKIGVWEIWAGRRREVVGLADSTIGIGPYSWSGNSLPIPKIQLALPDYTAIPFTGNLLAIRGLYAHGWFPNQGYINGSKLHQKALYLRFGKPAWPITFYGGINHQVQWGGQSENLSAGFIRNGQLPASLSDYVDIVTAKSLGARQHVDTSRYSPFDRENRIGNHLGTVDVGLEFKTRNFSLLVYRQSIYDDGSLFHLANLTDGLHGVRYVRRKPAFGLFTVQRVLLEFLNTMHQGGAVFENSSPKLRGRDNYFNHGQYRDGWSYQGRTIGTPFIPPSTATAGDLPRNWFTNNNRVMALHAALVGSVDSRYILTLKCSVSENVGTYEAPFSKPVRQLSSMVLLQIPMGLSGWQIKAAAGLDRGALYTNSTGFYLGVRKNWETKALTRNQTPKKVPSYFLHGRGF